MVGTETMLNFGHVRADAFKALSSGTPDEDGYELLCVAQARHDEHIAIYCNALSHVTALSDFLEHGAWCDDVPLPTTFADDDASQRLFRYFTSAFLLVDQCLEDMRDLLKAAGRTGRLLDDAHQFMGFINRVWKHRNRESGSAAAFHTAHHHGPYLYADLPSYESALPANGRYLSLGTCSSDGGAPLPILVPSLTDAARAIGMQVVQIATILEDEVARAKVEAPRVARVS